MRGHLFDECNELIFEGLQFWLQTFLFVRKILQQLYIKNKNPVLYNLFSSFGVFSSAEIEQIISQFELKTYPKVAIVLDFGKINDKLYLIESGIFREFSMKDQTINHWLMAENDFQYVADSFLEEKPSTVAIDVLEKAILWVISKEKLDKLYLEYPQLNFMGRLLYKIKVK